MGNLLHRLVQAQAAVPLNMLEMMEQCGHGTQVCMPQTIAMSHGAAAQAVSCLALSMAPCSPSDSEPTARLSLPVYHSLQPKAADSMQSTLN